MTWAEGVEKVLDEVSTFAEGDDLDKVIANVALEVTRKIVDTMSLARIATALYKIAGLEDNEDPSKFVEGLVDE